MDGFSHLRASINLITMELLFITVS